MLVYAKDIQSLINNNIVLREEREGLEEAKVIYKRLVKEYGDDWDKIKSGWIKCGSRKSVGISWNLNSKNRIKSKGVPTN